MIQSTNLVNDLIKPYSVIVDVVAYNNNGNNTQLNNMKLLNANRGIAISKNCAPRFCAFCYNDNTQNRIQLTSVNLLNDY